MFLTPREPENVTNADLKLGLALLELQAICTYRTTESFDEYLRDEDAERLSQQIIDISLQDEDRFMLLISRTRSTFSFCESEVCSDHVSELQSIWAHPAIISFETN